MKKCIVFCCCFFSVIVSVVAEELSVEQLAAGNELVQQKKYAQAEAHFQTLLKAHPNQLGLLNNLAVVQMALGKTEAAAKSLNQAIASDRLYAISKNNLSQVYAYMASRAYNNALDKPQQDAQKKLPQLALINELTITPAVKEEAISEAEIENIEPADIDPSVIIKQNIDNWASAWMNGDVNRYLGYYAQDFKPADKVSYQDWRNQRRYRLRNARNVKVGYNQLSIYFNGQQQSAIAEFVQHYSAGNYQDKVIKQLYWIRRGDNWLIVREQVAEQI